MLVVATLSRQRTWKRHTTATFATTGNEFKTPDSLLWFIFHFPSRALFIQIVYGGENLLLTTGRKQTSRTKSRPRNFIVKKLTWSHCFGKPVEFVEFLTKLDTLKEISPWKSDNALFHHLFLKKWNKREKTGKGEEKKHGGNKWDKFGVINENSRERYDIRV